MKFSVYELLATKCDCRASRSKQQYHCSNVSIDNLTNAQGLSLAVDCMATNFITDKFCNFRNYMIIIKTVFMKLSY